MADIAVEARELKRSFNKGKFVAVNGLSLDIKYGQIHALLGPNGAGNARRKLAQVLQDVQLSQYARARRPDQPDRRG